jgi:hypothetical protein
MAFSILHSDLPEPIVPDTSFPASHLLCFPDGRKLITLRDAADYITSQAEKETDLSEWQVAIEA